MTRSTLLSSLTGITNFEFVPSISLPSPSLSFFQYFFSISAEVFFFTCLSIFISSLLIYLSPHFLFLCLFFCLSYLFALLHIATTRPAPLPLPLFSSFSILTITLSTILTDSHPYQALFLSINSFSQHPSLFLPHSLHPSLPFPTSSTPPSSFLFTPSFPTFFSPSSSLRLSLFLPPLTHPILSPPSFTPSSPLNRTQC